MDKKQLMYLALKAIVEAVKEAGTIGAPAGVMYAAMNERGVQLAQFEQIMSALVRAGKLRKDGCVYHFVADL